MTRNSDPQPEPAAVDRDVRELTEDEAERAAAQFRAAWQTQAPEPAAGGAAALLQDHQAPNAEASGGVAAHPIVAIAAPASEAAAEARPSSSPLGRTMVGVPPPPSAAHPAAPESAAPGPPAAAAFNRTVVGIPAPALGAGLNVEKPATAPHFDAPAAAGAATAGAMEWRTNAAGHSGAPM